MKYDLEILDEAVFQDFPDAVSFCEHVSRRHGEELTLEQAQSYLEHAESICSCHLIEVGDDGYCQVDP